MTKAAFYSSYFLALVFALLFCKSSSAQFVTRYYSGGVRMDVDTSIFFIAENDDTPYLPFESDLLMVKEDDVPSNKSEPTVDETLMEFYVSTESYSSFIESFREPGENDIVDSTDLNGFRIYTLQTLKNTCDMDDGDDDNAAVVDTSSSYDIMMSRLDGRTIIVRPDMTYSFESFKKNLALIKELSARFSVASAEELDAHFHFPLSKEDGQRIVQKEYDEVYQVEYKDMLRIYKCSDMLTLRNYLEGIFDEKTADTLALRDAEVIAKAYAHARAHESTSATQYRINLLVETQFNFRECEHINKLILEDANAWNLLLNRILVANDSNMYHRLDKLNTFQRWHSFVLPPSPQYGNVVTEQPKQIKLARLSAALLYNEIARHLYNDTVRLVSCEIIPNEHQAQRALLLIQARDWNSKRTFNRLVKLEQNQEQVWNYQELKLPFDGDSVKGLEFNQYPLKNDFGFMLKYSPNGWDHYLVFNNDIDNATALETRYMSAVYGGPLKMCAINSWKNINQLEARSSDEYYAPLAAINTDSLFPAFQAKFPIPDFSESRYHSIYRQRGTTELSQEFMVFNDSTWVNKQAFYSFVYTKLIPKQKELICYPIASDLTGDGQEEFFQFAISNGKLLDWWVYTFDEKGTRKMSKHRAKQLIKRTVIYNNMKYASKMGVIEQTVE